MIRFSIIVDNIKLKKDLYISLKSILKQTYTDFEVLIPIENKEAVTKKFNSSNIKFYDKLKISGEYTLYVKSGLELDENLLKKINKKISINRNLDVIRFNSDIKIQNEPGYSALNKLSKEPFFNTKYLYFIKSLLSNNLISYTILKSEQVTSINIEGYKDYVNEENIFDEYDQITKLVKKNKGLTRKEKNSLLNYIINKLFNYSNCVDDFDNYVKEIEKMKIYKIFPVTNIKDRIVRLLIEKNVRLIMKKYRRGI